MLGDNATEQAIAELREQMGLNDPILFQYGRYMLRLVQGDMGFSYSTKRPVFGEIMHRLPNTFILAFVGMFLGVCLSIPIGIISATKQYSLADRLSMLVALLGVSMPNFWVALMLITIFSLFLGILPSGGNDSVKSIILPAVSIGLGVAANITRTTRSSMLEVIRQDYIRTAKSKGVGRKVVIRKHALKNALIPIVTVVGIQFGVMLGGAIYCETVFSWPGLGRLMVDSIRAKDTPQLLGCIVVFAVTFSIVNLLIDLIYAFIDPRIKSQYKH
jgi:peptide/nickel transport system permease protein